MCFFTGPSSAARSCESKKQWQWFLPDQQADFSKHILAGTTNADGRRAIKIKISLPVHPARHRFANNLSFSARRSPLIAASRFRAADLDFWGSLKASRTGSRLRVYFEALPAVWAWSRLGRSLVMPV
jgi:hypothetical protein